TLAFSPTDILYPLGRIQNLEEAYISPIDDNSVLLKWYKVNDLQDDLVSIQAILDNVHYMPKYLILTYQYSRNGERENYYNIIFAELSNYVDSPEGYFPNNWIVTRRIKKSE